MRSRLGWQGWLLLVCVGLSVPVWADDADPTEEETAVLEGVVVDEAGQPVPNVAVEARRGSVMRWFVADVNSADPFDGLETTPSASGQPSPDRRLVRTDAEGRFRFEGLRDASGFVLRARPEPPRRGRGAILHEAPRAGESHRLVVEEGRAITGRLVDAKGRPLKGWITAHAVPGRDRFFGETWLLHGYLEQDLATDEDGRFAFTAPKDTRVRIDAFFPGDRYIASLAFLERNADTVTVVVPTEGGASIQGHVRDLEGKPVLGARVLVAVRQHDMGYRPTTTAFARSDTEGAFAIHHLPATQLDQISIQAPGFAVWNRGVYMTPLVEKEPLEVDATLVPSARLVLRVVDEAGQGVPNPEVYFVGEMVPGHNQAWTRIVQGDEEGLVRIDDLPAGKGSFQVWTESHYLPVPSGRRALDNPLAQYYASVEPGDEREIRVVLKQGATLRGQVLDHRGQPVPHAALDYRLHRSDAPRGNGFVMRRGQTDAEGRFRLGGLPSLASLTLNVRLEGQPRVETQVDTSALNGDQPEPVRILLPEPARVEGRVVDAAGQPVAGVLVQCEGTSARVVSDAVGRFDFPTVLPGRRRVFLGAVLSGASSPFLELEPGQTVNDLTLRHPGAGIGVLEGQVVEADGAPAGLLYVDVRSTSDTGLTARALTDAGGRFRLERVPLGTYTLSAGSRPITATIGDSGVALVTIPRPAAKPSYVLRGVIVDPDGKPVDFASVRIAFPEDGEHTARGQTVAMGGRFSTRVEGTPRELRLRITNARDARGQRVNHAPASVLVPSPVEGPVLVALQPALRLRGRVLEADGRPIPGLPITLTKQVLSPGGRGLYIPPIQARTDEEGRFDVPGLGSEAYAVGFPYSQVWIPPEAIVARAGEGELEIRLQRWQQLATLVTAPGGAPVEGCRVEAYVLGEGRPRGTQAAMTNAEGRAEHPHLRPGDELMLRVLPPHPGEGAVADLCGVYKEGVSPGGEPVQIQLGPGARLGGRVVDRAGRPIPRARVDLQLLEMDGPPVPGMAPLFQPRQKTVTDARGAFLFRRLPPSQPASLTVSHSGAGGHKYFREQVRDLVSGNESIEVVLQGVVSIEGAVPNVEASALKGVNVRAQPLLRGYPTANFRFDGNRTSFRLTGLRPGPYELHVRGGRNVIYDEVQTVEAPSESVELRVRLVHDLAGAVLGAEGTEYLAEFHIDGYEPFKANVDQGGLFRFHHLPDAKGTLVIHRAGENRVAVVEGVYTGRKDPLITELIEGLPIAGTIVGQGRPLAGGRVIATRGTFRFEGPVAEDGVWRTPALPPGTYELEFEFKYPKDGFVPTPTTVEAGTTDLVLEWASR